MIINKNGKQLETYNYNNYRILSGTVDNKNPKALFLTISAWGETLLDDNINYNNVFKNIIKGIKKEINSNINQNLFHNERCIVDFDMRESGISCGKKSFINCEITLYQKNLFKLQDKLIQKELKTISDLVANNILENNKYFKFTKTKN